MPILLLFWFDNYMVPFNQKKKKNAIFFEILDVNALSANFADLCTVNDNNYLMCTFKAYINYSF